MMLASPLLPAPTIFSSTSEEPPLQYRPARDREAFDSLLPPPVEFVEGSSSGALAVPPGKYEPINASPKLSKPDRLDPLKPPASTPVKHSLTSAPHPKSLSLYPHGIDTTWPESYNRGSGLLNNGNTCFLNSTLQCLLHTPPLLRILHAHHKHSCRVQNGFCMSCGMRSVLVQSYTQQSTFSPTVITTKLQVIAKNMRRGRQEDSHEFLRYAIDALQKSCLAGYSPKLDTKLAETTWVHKIFGGQLRSRVTCHSCGHNSDTFDRILDLSVDIHQSDALKDALRKFVAVDHLRGADKYKCEKCKKHVIAEKQFTVHDAPLVLTVHFKRFTPLGKKISHHIQYDEHLTLQPYMSEGQYGPSYSLYGVVCHLGGGPNSGHYYAFVKSRDGRWWEMNDESVTRIGSPPLDRKNAYMLFYLRKKGQGLEAAVNRTTTRSKPSLISAMKRRKEREPEPQAVEDGEDTGTAVAAPFIGPLLPPPSQEADTPDLKRQKVNGTDPQAALIRKKIEAAAAANGALKGLDVYDSDDDQEPSKVNEEAGRRVCPPERDEASSPSPLPPPSSSVPPENFYATPNFKKRKVPDDDSDVQHRTPIQSRSNGYISNMNPYHRMSNNHRRHAGKPRGV